MLFFRNVNKIVFWSIKYVELRTNKTPFAGSFTFFSIRSNVLLEIIDCKYWFKRFKSDNFDMKDKERRGHPKKIEDEKLGTLLDEDPCQTQDELAESLGVDRSTISKRLYALGMIQRQGNWVLYKLKSRDVDLTACQRSIQFCKTGENLLGNA